MAANANPEIDTAVQEFIRPSFADLASATQTLAIAAQADCDSRSATLRKDFGIAWDAWLRISALRFGPTETEDRAFALGFWPDPHGLVHRSLEGLINDKDPIINDPEAFATYSIAARGFTAMEYLLYDEKGLISSDYHCKLVQAVATDINITAEAINDDWQGDYGDWFLAAGKGGDHNTISEDQTRILTALTTGLEFTRDNRIARPVGTEERPRPKRAEAWRSERALRHIAMSIEGASSLATIMAKPLDEAHQVETAFGIANEAVATITDPSLQTAVISATGRAQLGALSAAVRDAQHAITDVIVEPLGLIQGFNALDGD